MTKKGAESSCPICGNSLKNKDSSQTAPFCSKKCKILDLGKWLDGAYALGDDDDE